MHAVHLLFKTHSSNIIHKYLAVFCLVFFFFFYCCVSFLIPMSVLCTVIYILRLETNLGVRVDGECIQACFSFQMRAYKRWRCRHSLTNSNTSPTKHSVPFLGHIWCQGQNNGAYLSSLKENGKFPNVPFPHFYCSVLFKGAEYR